MMTNYIDIQGLSKSYDGHLILDNFSLQLESQRFATLLGPSGCGKSTTLKLISGLERPDKGEIRLGGNDITVLPPYKRNTILVFQSYALFPHMSVFENVAYGLKRHKVNRSEIKERVTHILHVTQLDGLDERYPSQLSGGQQQRVALARSLVLKPDLLLLDEPLSNLDAKLRNEMRIEIRLLHERLGLTTLFVTHDQEEAFSISDDIIVMNNGRILQHGSPEDVFLHPKDSFVAEFTGVKNIFEGSSVESLFTTADGLSFRIGENADPTVHKYGIRPANVMLNPAQGSADVVFDGEVELKTYKGDAVELLVTTAGKTVFVSVPSSDSSLLYLRRGDSVSIGWNTKNLIPLRS
jgi:ABC-type Fe3+/spermidine/putrescine transport system ATPase subunit